MTHKKRDAISVPFFMSNFTKSTTQSSRHNQGIETCYTESV